MLQNLLTEQRNPASENIDGLKTADLLGVINAEDEKVAGAVKAAIPSIARAVDCVVAQFRQGGRLFYIGAGTSGRLGVLDASECPPTYSVPHEMVQGIIAGGEAALSRATEASEDDPASGARDLLARGFTRNDVLLGIATSGRTPYVLGAVNKAGELGAHTIGLSCSPASELSAAVEFPIEVLPGAEVVTGSTRMKAGTATKLVLNMISTAAMIRLGFVFGNLMVNVQPRNSKLADRAARIIADATGVPREEAERLLERGGSVKTAIVMQMLQTDRAAAESALERAGGAVRKALEGHG